jgi:hypothetical protein
MDFSNVPSILIISCLVFGGRQLKFLTLESVHISESIQRHAEMHNPNLILIKIIACHTLTDEVSLKAFVRLASLRVLTLDSVYMVSSAKSLINVCLGNAKLKILTILRHQHITLDALNEIFKEQPSIIEVRCGSCPLISSTSVSFKRTKKDSLHLQLEFLSTCDENPWY